MKNYKELDVWMMSRKLVSQIYLASQNFPKEEMFGLKSQIRRAAVSIPSNIAEGCGRNHKRDAIQFFFIARGSLYEVETQTYLANDLGYFDSSNTQELLQNTEQCRMILNGFIRYYESQIPKK